MQNLQVITSLKYLSGICFILTALIREIYILNYIKNGG